MFYLIEDSSKSVFGGGQQISLEVCQRASLLSDRVVVIDSSAHDEFIQLIKYTPNITVLRYNVKKRKFVGNSSSIQGVTDIIRELVSAYATFASISQHIESSNSNIYYCATKYTAFIGILLRMRNQGRVYFHNHSATSNLIIRIIVDIISRSLLDRIILPSRFMQTQHKLSLSKTIVINNFIDDKYYIDCKRNETERINIGFIGAALHWKGAHLFDQIAGILSGDSSLTFVAFGKNPVNHNFKNITFTWTNDVHSALKDISILLLPSLSPESFCLVAAQAAALGITIIYRPIGALPELLADYSGGVVIESTSPSDWVAGIEACKSTCKKVHSWPSKVAYSKQLFIKSIDDLIKN